jgi:DNA-directed RNA polymerase specialized sigma24 family protein
MNASKDEGGLLESMSRIERLLDLIARIEVQRLRGDKSQTETILMLAQIGFRTGEISSAINVPVSTIAPIVSRQKQKKAPVMKRKHK